MNLLEAEVYAIHSPIWDLHFKDSDFKKILLSGILLYVNYSIIFYFILEIFLLSHCCYLYR